MNRVSLFVVGLIATVAIIVTAQFVAAVYQGPKQAFPEGNPPAPLDTGNKFQYKGQGIGFSEFNGVKFEGKAIELGIDQTLNIKIGANTTPFLFPYQSADRYTMIQPGSAGLVIGNAVDKLDANGKTYEQGRLCFGAPRADGTNCKSSWDGLVGGASESFWELAGTSLVASSTTWNVGIGTDDTPSKLSVQGNVSLMRAPGGSVLAGPGPTLALQSPSNDVTTQASGQSYCGGSGQPACPTDNCPVGDATNNNNYPAQTTFYACGVGTGGTSCTDVGHIVGSTQLEFRTVSCVAGTSQYSLRTNSGTLEFLNNDSVAKMTMTQNGNVGIGKTPTADYAVEVEGKINTTGGFFKNGVEITGGGGGTSQWSNGTNGIIFYNGGNVGIGTNGPVGLLHLYKNDGPATMVMAARSGNWWWTSTNDDSTKLLMGATGATRPAEANYPLVFSNGNIGIGTLNPGTKLDVNGTIAIRGGSPGEGKVLTSDANGVASWRQQGKKVCSVIGSGWRDTINVPDDWNWLSCDGYRQTVRASAFQLGCLTVSSFGVGMIEWGGEGGGVPNPNTCNWVGTNLSWQYVDPQSAEGAYDQTCLSWLSGLGQVGTQRRTVRSDGSTHVGECVYRYINGGIIYGSESSVPSSGARPVAAANNNYTQVYR